MTTPRTQAARGLHTIVVGSGSAGLFLALEGRRLGPVTVLTKSSLEDCNTHWAQGGIAAAIGALDSPEQHFRDTVAAGAGLVDERAARVLCEEAPGRIRDLVTYGVPFDRGDGELALGREAAHGHNRILHAGGDRTGAALESALAAAARTPGIRLLERRLVTRLLVVGGRVRGVDTIDLDSGRHESHEADAVVLATGGAGRLYSHTTNPEVATGDGIALAFEAGAEVADMEFYQFHPTALRLAGAPPFLISEAIRGEGAILRNAAGERFMPRYDERAELAPRDVVARAILAEMQAAGTDHVELDCTGIRGVDLAARFPGIFGYCKERGVDIREAPIPVAPAAHYYMGGVRTDTHGRTTLPGLYAAGECACTGVHGANRLASNSLMETVVFAKRVVEHLESGASGSAPSCGGARRMESPAGLAPSREELQGLMWRDAGMQRDGPGLSAALATVRGWRSTAEEATRDWHERRQMTVAATLLLEAARARAESRGAHARVDYPERDDDRWARRQVLVRAS